MNCTLGRSGKYPESGSSTEEAFEKGQVEVIEIEDPHAGMSSSERYRAGKEIFVHKIRDADLVTLVAYLEMDFEGGNFWGKIMKILQDEKTKTWRDDARIPDSWKKKIDKAQKIKGGTGLIVNPMLFLMSGSAAREMAMTELLRRIDLEKESKMPNQFAV